MKVHIIAPYEAFDIAGKNIADEKSMLAAIQSAIELAPKQ